MLEQESYRHSHSAPGYGARYKSTYTRGYYAAQWREIEKELLLDFVRKLKPNAQSSLDFACGTGRITEALAECSAHVTGVDVSLEMLKEAQRADQIELVHHDLTKESLNAKFDVITAFRFFLNAEPQLRADALFAIREHLDDSGILIANIHMSSHSLMGFVYRLIRLVTRKTLHNTMSLDDFTSELESSGFEVNKVVFYSFLPRPFGFGGKLIDYLVGPFEKVYLALRLPKIFGQSFMVAAKVKSR